MDKHKRLNSWSHKLPKVSVLQLSTQMGKDDFSFDKHVLIIKFIIVLNSRLKLIPTIDVRWAAFGLWLEEHFVLNEWNSDIKMFRKQRIYINIQFLFTEDKI